MKQNKIIILVVSILVIAGAAYGAYVYMQSKDNRSPESSSNTQNETRSANDGDQDATTSSGDQTVQGVLVDGFPGNKIPLYLGDIVESKKSKDSMGSDQYNVSIQTSDNIEKVIDLSKRNYMNDGWDIRTNPTDKMFVSHSDEFIVTVSFTENENGVLINYGITTK